MWNSSPPLGQSLFAEPNIMIDESKLFTEPSLKRSRGVGGSVDNMMAKFTAALKTRDVDTAARVLERVAQLFKGDDPRLLYLHNRYLELVVNDMIANQSTEEAMKKAMSLQMWFEVKLPQGNLMPDARTMAVMLRMALRMFHGSRRDRTVRRYWNMVQMQSFDMEVLAMSDILTERDLGEISQVSVFFYLIGVDEQSEKLTVFRIQSSSALQAYRISNQKLNLHLSLKARPPPPLKSSKPTKKDLVFRR